MKVNFADPFRQLVERRLWPLALVLLLALAAIPMLLARDAEVPPAPLATAAQLQTAQSATEPVVSLVTPGSHDRDRKVVGSRKDPFAPVPVKAAKADTPELASDAAKATSDAGKASSGGGSASAGGGTTAPGVTVPVVTAPKKTYEVLSLTVRFGTTEDESLPRRNLKRLTSLPDAEAPVVIYLGLLKDNKTAVFLVDATAKAQGDGNCDPTPANCQTVALKPGETEFFDVIGADGATTTQYQLDYVKVARKKTASAKAARAARAATAAGGRDALRARQSRLGRLRFDKRSGTLKKLSVRAWKAQAARASAR